MEDLKTNFDQMNLLAKENCKKLESFLIFLKEWTLYEELYAQGMERIFNKLVNDSHFNDFLINFHSFIGIIVQRSRDFGHKLNQITKNFNETLVEESNSLKRIYSDFKNILNSLDECYNKTTESLDHYYSSIQLCDEIATKIDDERSVSKKEKLLKELIKVQRPIKKKLIEFQDALEGYNSLSKRHNPNIHKVIKGYKTYSKNIQESYEKSLVYIKEAIIPRYFLQADVDARIFDFELPIIKTSVEDFIFPEIIPEKFIGNHPLFINSQGSILMHNCSLLETSGLLGLSSLIETAYKDEIEFMITKAWEGEEIGSEHYLKFNNIMKDPIGRKTFCYCLNIRRNQGKFVLPEAGYAKIGELLQAILNECERFDDIDAAKNIIILSQTFYKKDNYSKDFLQNFIMSHSLWQKLKFWETAIEFTIFEELKKQTGENFEENKETEAMNHKSLIFANLLSFGYIMKGFKISSDSVNELISKYGDKYKFTKNETKEIIKEINNSINRNSI
jgi:Myotubularin protein